MSKPKRGTPGRMDPFVIRLRQLITDRQYSYEEFGKRIGASKTHISNLCNGATYPSVPLLIAISRAEGVTTDWLLGLQTR